MYKDGYWQLKRNSSLKCGFRRYEYFIKFKTVTTKVYVPVSGKSKWILKIKRTNQHKLPFKEFSFKAMYSVSNAGFAMLETRPKRHFSYI